MVRRWSCPNGMMQLLTRWMIPVPRVFPWWGAFLPTRLDCQIASTPVASGMAIMRPSRLSQKVCSLRSSSNLLAGRDTDPEGGGFGEVPGRDLRKSSAENCDRGFARTTSLPSQLRDQATETARSGLQFNTISFGGSACVVALGGCTGQERAGPNPLLLLVPVRRAFAVHECWPRSNHRSRRAV